FATDVAAAEAGHRTAAGAGNVDVAASHDRDVGLLSDHEIDVTRPGDRHGGVLALQPRSVDIAGAADRDARETRGPAGGDAASAADRSEEHTSELQSRENLVCRLLLEKKKEKASLVSI